MYARFGVLSKSSNYCHALRPLWMIRAVSSGDDWWLVSVVEHGGGQTDKLDAFTRAWTQFWEPRKDTHLIVVYYSHVAPRQMGFEKREGNRIPNILSSRTKRNGQVKQAEHKNIFCKDCQTRSLNANGIQRSGLQGMKYQEMRNDRH